MLVFGGFRISSAEAPWTGQANGDVLIGRVSGDALKWALRYRGGKWKPASDSDHKAGTSVFLLSPAGIKAQGRIARIEEVQGTAGAILAAPTPITARALAVGPGAAATSVKLAPASTSGWAGSVLALLKTKKWKGTRPRVTHVWQVDLNGNGKKESVVEFEAVVPSGPTENADRSGHYSGVALAAGSRLLPLARHVLDKGDEIDVVQSSLLGAIRLGPTGKPLLVVWSGGWEGWFECSLFTYDGARAVRVAKHSYGGLSRPSRGTPSIERKGFVSRWSWRRRRRSMDRPDGTADPLQPDRGVDGQRLHDAHLPDGPRLRRRDPPARRRCAREDRRHQPLARLAGG